MAVDEMLVAEIFVEEIVEGTMPTTEFCISEGIESIGLLARLGKGGGATGDESFSPA